MKNEKKKSATQVVKEIKRRTRRTFSAEEKIKAYMRFTQHEKYEIIKFDLFLYSQMIFLQ